MSSDSPPHVQPDRLSETVANPAPTLFPRVALEHVNVHLAGRHVLRDVSWSLNAGEHWAFVGPNGSGKSTLLRVIAGRGWIDGDGGRRTYSRDGVTRDAVGRATTWIRLVSAEQHEYYARLDLPLTGRVLIASGFDDSVYLHRPTAPAQTRRIDALIATFGLELFVDDPIRMLSSGQLRRLLIARALVGEPRILVLDEFTNGLDRAARHEVRRALEDVAALTTLVIASHRGDDFPAPITHTATIDAGIVVARAGRPVVTPDRTSVVPATASRLADEPQVLLRFRRADVYRGDALVLRDVNWELRRGEHTLVRGKNGAGKSTFAGLIAGTISAATGAAIERFGQTGPFNIWRLKERVAHVSDDLQIAYDRADTVEAVIASGFTASIGLFVEPTASQRAAVADLIDRIGIDALRGRSLRQLSFGERRKVLIARSLVRRPAILILDEVWNGLDVAFRAHLRTLLDELADSGSTLVAIAHDDDEDIAALAPRVCEIDGGRVREVTSAVTLPHVPTKTV